MALIPTAEAHWPMYENTNYSTWHLWECSNNIHSLTDRRRCDEMVYWVQRHIPDWITDVQWKHNVGRFTVRLRKDKDAVLFTLKYGRPNYE